MKKSGLFLISLMVLILSLGVLSCEVGLGAQVDTLPPTVEITSPIGSPRVRGDFAIKGNWNDDGKLAKIDVELVGANGKYKISDPSSFTISDKTWQVNVPAKTQKYLDGEYTAKVTCTDDGNRPTIVSQNIVIDNTPPVVIIETPAFAANSSDKDTFGKLLSFTGTVYDETRVNEIKLNFGEGYGDAGLIIPEDQPERTISSYNPETVKFAIDLTDDETKDLYKGIYGWGKLDPESENPETPIRFYTLTATDNAQCYPIEGPQTDEDKIGNKAEVFYLATNENVRRWIDNYHVDAATIYKVLNGTYKKTGVNDLDPNKINDIKNNLSSAATNAGQFELNPKNNPCYYTDNANLLTDENGFESSRITANEESALIVKIEKGIDGYQIDKDNVKIYLYEFDTNNDDLDGFAIEGKTPIEVNLGKNGVVPTITAGNYTYKIGLKNPTHFSKELPKNGGRYIVRVIGEDKKGNTITKKGVGSDYGFFFETPNSFTKIEIQNLKIGNKAINDGDIITEKGDVSLNVNIVDEAFDTTLTENFKLVLTFKLGDTLVTKEFDKYTSNQIWKIPVSDAFTNDEYFSAKITADLIGKNTQSNNESGMVGQSKNFAAIDFIYDKIAPTVEVIYPNDGSAVRENKLVLTGKAYDEATEPKSVSGTLTGTVDNETQTITLGDITVSNNKWNKEVDLSGFKAGPVKLTLWGTDKYDNSGKDNDIKQLHSNFTIDRENPSFGTLYYKLEGEQEPKEWIGEIFTNSSVTISGTVSDDYKLAENPILLKINGFDRGIINYVDPNASEIPGPTKKWNFTISSKDKDRGDKDLYNNRLNSVVLIANDSTKNTATKSNIITIDTTKPSIGNGTFTETKEDDTENVLFTEDNATDLSFYSGNNTININVIVNDELSGVESASVKVINSNSETKKEVPENRLSINRDKNNISATGSVTIPEQYQGENIIRIEVKDRAGNTNTKDYTVTLDTKAPDIKDIKYFSNDVTENTKIDVLDSSTVLGGTTKNLIIKFTAEDVNGVASVESIGATITTVPESLKDAPKSVVCTVAYDISAMKSGFQDIAIFVKDKTGKTAEIKKQLNIDNTAPVVTITSPKSTKDDALSGLVSAQGSVDSEAGLEFAITKDDTKPEPTAFVKLTDIKDKVPSWTIKFDNDNTNEIDVVHTKSLNEWIKDFNKGETDFNIETYTTITPLYLWVKATDKVGNTNYEQLQSYEIFVDPQGDRPTIEIVNPLVEGAAITDASGALRISGSVEDKTGINPGVKTVWMQVISNQERPDDGKYYDGKDAPLISEFNLTAADVEFMETAFSGQVMEMPVAVSGTKWAVPVKVSNTGSWNIEINANDKFNSKSDKTTNVVGVKFIVEDNDGKMNITSLGENGITYGKVINIRFDSAKPQIKDLKLTNEDGRTVAYVPDMYIRGTGGWSLVGTVTDNETVASIRVKDKGQSGKLPVNCGSNLNTTEATFIYDFDSHGTSTAGDNGKINLLLDACDGTEGRNTIEQNIVINFDNQAPVLTLPGADGKPVEGYKIDTNIAQKDSFYTFGSRASEETLNDVNQSGVAFVAAFFKRGSNIINPLLDRENNVRAVSTVGDAGLYWTSKRISDVTDVKDLNGVTRSQFTVSDLSNDNFIHVNGLVKINNTYYLIKEINDNKVTIEGLLVGESKTADFADAFVINNPIQESEPKSDKKMTNGYFDTVTNDDGDKMIEVCKKTGANWDWEASICSKNIPDGAIELHYVVFDNAGNHAGATVSGVVKNNAPRIAGFKIQKYSRNINGTDKSYKEDGEIIDNFSIEKHLSEYQTGEKGGEKIFDWDEPLLSNKGKKEPLPTAPIFGSPEKPVATISDKIEITPEIVGGNGAVYYSYQLNDSIKADNNLVGQNLENPIIDNGSVDYTAKTGTITVGKGDLLRISPDNATKAVPFKFTFWDSTYGSAFDGKSGDAIKAELFNKEKNPVSQTADMTIYLKLKTGSGKPIVNVKDFYWNSEYNNSLYNESRKEGHIEFPNDWKETKAYKENNPEGKITTGLYDLNPKVSGKIKIEGTVTDANGVGSITFNLPGIGEKTVAINSAPTPESSNIDSLVNTQGYALVVNSNETIDAENVVTWTLIWDTESVIKETNAEDKVGLDKSFSVKGTNVGKYTCKTTQDSNGDISVDGKTRYALPTATGDALSSDPIANRVDIVPYIVGFSYKGSSLARATSGAFSIARGNGGIKFEGFNIAGSENIAATIEPRLFNTKYTVTIGDDGSCDVPLTAVSGDFVVSVGGIPAMNSINNNNAASNREMSQSYGIKDYSDDRYVHVWRVSPDDVFEGSLNCEFPTMSKDPTTGKLYSAFSNGGYGSIYISPNFVKSENLKQEIRDNTTDLPTPTNRGVPFDTIRRVYNMPGTPGDLDLSITRNGDVFDADVAYGANYRAGAGDQWKWSGYNCLANNTGGAYLYTDNNYVPGEIGLGTSKFNAYRGQLFCYNKTTNNFVNMRVLRNGDYVYTAYYDKVTSTINFSAVKNFAGATITDNTSGLGGNDGYGQPHSTNNDGQNASMPWVSIDGNNYNTYIPEHFNGTGGVASDTHGKYNPICLTGFPGKGQNGKVQYCMPMKLNENNFKSVNGRASRTGEYVALAVDTDGYPIVVYVNADNGNLRIARSISKSGTLAYVESVATAGRKYWTDDLTKACTKKVYDDRESKWTVEELNISNYGAATGNLSCEVDPDGYLHIVYAADGKLVYIKSANATSGGKGAVGIDNTLSCVLDNRGSNVDIRIGEKATIGGKSNSYVPYISYVATPNSTNGLKLAFPYDVDGKNGIGAKEFEVMTAPSTSLIRDAKTCIELDALANAASSTNDKKEQEQYAAAIGVYTGRDYRALFYVGDKSTYITPTEGDGKK